MAESDSSERFFYRGRGELRFDEISEEDLDSEASKRPKTDINKPFCDTCFGNVFLSEIRVVASYLCYVCGKYYCNNCFSVHDKSHGFICMESKTGELDGEIVEFVSYMMNESDDESEKKLMEDDVCVCDYVSTKHGLDKKFGFITGITGYEKKWWVVCDVINCCIKVFCLSSNVLQRYITFGSISSDVTEITVKNKTTEQDAASTSEAAISGTSNKPDSKHLLAVALPLEHLILILDFGKKPAVIHSKIKTEKECWRIDFYDGNIYIACREKPVDSPFFVYIMSVEGGTLKTFQTVVRLESYLTVLNGNIYMTDNDNHRVVCYNDEGRVLHESTLDGSWPKGICVDRSEDKVYIFSRLHRQVYEMNSDLSRYKPVLGQTTRYMERPETICFYSHKLYVGHLSDIKLDFVSHITVVRLL